MFNLIVLGEHAGSGVPDIFHAWKEVGLEEPIVEEKFGEGNPDRTVLTLPLISDNSPIRQLADSTDVNGRHKQILSVMEENHEYSSTEVAELIGLKGSRTRQLLKELVDAGRIEATGNTNGKRYIKH